MHLRLIRVIGRIAIAHTRNTTDSLYLGPRAIVSAF